MAMTLRTDDDQDAKLGALAAAWGVSRQQAALRAIEESYDRVGHRARVREASAVVRAEWAETLDELAK